MTLRREGTTFPPARNTGSAVEDALVERLRALGARLDVPLDDDFRRNSRTRLVAMAAVRTPAASAGAATAGRNALTSRLRGPDAGRSPWRRLVAGPGGPAWRWRRATAGLAAAGLTLVALGALLALSQPTGPGDVLYPVKLSSEHTRLALAGDSRRGRTLLGFAGTRLRELTELTGGATSALPAPAAPTSGGSTLLAAGTDTPRLLRTLQTMDDQTTEGTWWLTTQAVRAVDPGALTTLTAWAGNQEAGLAALDGSLPAEAHQAYLAATDLVSAVADRGSALRDALSCAGGPATAGTDDLGPVPASCPAAFPLPAPQTPAPQPGGSSADTHAGAGTSAALPAGPDGLAGPSGAAAPAPAGGSTSRGGARPSVPSVDPGPTSGPVPASDVPGYGGLPVPLPPLPGGTSASPPPAIDLPLPLCVSALAVPIVC